MEQSLQVMSKQERLENWGAKIPACRSSGMTVHAWCQENGISEKTYYYWQRQLFRRLTEAQPQNTVFVEVTPPKAEHSNCIPFPVVFRGILLETGEKWRGERQVNPTEKPLQTSRSTKKK